MFLRCLYYFISVSCASFFLGANSVVWWFNSFLSSFILISLSFSSFSFYFKIKSCFSSWTLLFCSSTSIFCILSFHSFYVSFLYCSSAAIWVSSYWIIYVVTGGLCCVFLDFYFSLFYFILLSIYFILFCLTMKISWFLRSVR